MISKLKYAGNENNISVEILSQQMPSLITVEMINNTKAYILNNTLAL